MSQTPSPEIPDAPWLNFDWVAHSQILLDSYQHWIGQELIPRVGTADDQAQALFESGFVVVSHGTQSDPILNYGNRTALKLWEISIEQLRQTPSRLTAEPLHRDERARLLERTTRQGYVDDYQGIRIATTGRRFRIHRATVWNLRDSAGVYLGQAATFSEWEFLEGQIQSDLA
ncbi:MAG: MEKHLA domain-containing protein [Planctomycetota bacterium]|nr:MEKHLA domain-containing protein [Planctomycetota bacterium]